MRSRRPESVSRAESLSRAESVSRADGAFALGAARRHVDLLRVSSALCPGGRCPGVLSAAHAPATAATR
jgi:hypothetical protein